MPTEIEIYENSGEPAFATVAVMEIACDATGKTAPTTIHPVILFDLNEDGLPEVVFGGHNLVFWNEGQFRFRRETLCAHPPGHVNAGVFADFTGDGITDYLCGIKTGFPGSIEVSLRASSLKHRPSWSLATRCSVPDWLDGRRH